MSQYILRSHKIYWDVTRSIEISQDLLRSHKIYSDLTRSTQSSQDLLRSHKVYWDLTRSTEISQDLPRSHKIFYQWLKDLHLMELVFVCLGILYLSWGWGFWELHRQHRHHLQAETPYLHPLHQHPSPQQGSYQGAAIQLYKRQHPRTKYNFLHKQNLWQPDSLKHFFSSFWTFSFPKHSSEIFPVGS